MKRKLHELSNVMGFTLIETLISLLVLSSILLIVRMTLVDFHQSDQYGSITRFYSYLDTVEDQRYSFTRCRTTQLVLSKNGKYYYINFNKYKHQIIMTTKKGGYILLMNNVKNATWNNSDKVVKHCVTLMNGQRFSGTSRFR